MLEDERRPLFCLSHCLSTSHSVTPLSPLPSSLQVTRLQSKVSVLEDEKRRTAARLSAVQTALQQLEREAAVRSQTRAEIEAATTSTMVGLWR